MRIGCVGMATLDTLLFVPDQELVHDTVLPVDVAVRCPGGKGMVTAAAVLEQGGEVVPFSLLGEDSELAELLSDGLGRVYQLQLLPNDSRTWISVSHAQKVVTFVSRADLPPRQERVALEAVTTMVEEVDVLYLTVEDPKILAAALKAARASDIPVALNASVPLLGLLHSAHRPLLADLIARSSLIFCNHMEDRRVLRALGINRWSDAPEPDKREVVVTEGPAGGRVSTAASDDWIRFESSPAESVRCVVGAGDTFNGAYITARWAIGSPPAESCRRGAELAARKVALRGSMVTPGDQSS